ncbi:hypothetical protein ACFVZW_26125 [Streptomyces sp. NPDC059567]|uniref:hypothetical protein n=1 Tax=Streptomyces sp. NPDC059567 TaxID=3346867 RepID=UPI00367A1D42
MSRLMVAAVAAILATTACAADGEGAAKGKTAADVCGGFAKDASPLAALTAIAGEGGLTDDRSKPDETLETLREADGKLTTQELATGSPFCRLRNASDGESVFDITFREALVVPGTRDRATFHYFSTGADALSSDRYAQIMFPCRMEEPAKDIIVSAELERPGESDASTANIPGLQVTVLNAAARSVATALGCGDPKLVDGVPAEERS